MQRILDLLLNEVKVSVITREKNWPSLQAKHGKYMARGGSPARVAYERDRLKSMGLNPDEPVSHLNYAQYTGQSEPRVYKNRALVDRGEAERILNTQDKRDANRLFRKTSNKGTTAQIQTGLKAMGGKPLGYNQSRLAHAKGLIQIKKQRKQQRQAAMRDHTEYYDRIATLLLAEADIKPEVLARVKKIQKARRDNEGKKQRIPSDGGPPPPRESESERRKRQHPEIYGKGNKTRSTVSISNQ